jgi:hypothetical protein
MTRNESYLAVPLTSGGGPLSGVKLKKEDQKLTLGSKVGLPLQSSHTPRGPQTPAVELRADILGQRDSRLQLTLQLVQEAPVGALGDQLVGAGADHPDLVEAQREEP